MNVITSASFITADSDPIHLNRPQNDSDPIIVYSLTGEPSDYCVPQNTLLDEWDRSRTLPRWQ